MSLVMKRLEKLEYFSSEGKAIKAEQAKIIQREGNLNQELGRWIEQELGLKGEFTMPDLLKVVLETSFEPKRIIAP